MKKALFAFILGLLFLPEIGIAQMYQSDAITDIGRVNGTGNILDCESECTILSYYIDYISDVANDGADNLYTLYCDSGFTSVGMGQVGSTGTFTTGFSNFSNNSQFTGHMICSGFSVASIVDPTSSHLYYRITYLPYNIHSVDSLGSASTSPLFVASTNTPSTNDWLFVSMVGIFLMSFVTWGYFFSPSKTRHAYSH